MLQINPAISDKKSKDEEKVWLLSSLQHIGHAWEKRRENASWLLGESLFHFWVLITGIAARSSSSSPKVLYHVILVMKEREIHLQHFLCHLFSTLNIPAHFIGYLKCSNVVIKVWGILAFSLNVIIFALSPQCLGIIIQNSAHRNSRNIWS